MYGITPARAGSSWSPFIVSPGNRDHPRSRGEQIDASLVQVCASGSPPLARGAVFRLSGPLRPVRITPARAGSRLLMTILQTWLGDHPRSRGEQHSTTSLPVIARGSPPLARGAVSGCDTNWGALRITPARAGSRSLEIRQTKQQQDHPRSRGEQYSACEGLRC